jgi:hypothetical protein
MKKFVFTKLLVAACCIIGIGALYAPPSYAVTAYNGTISDNFDGATLNTRLWKPFQNPQTQWVQQGGELRLTLGQGAGSQEGAGVKSKFSLKGDFEMTVDYRLITWPPANGVRLGFEGPGFSADDYTEFMIKRVSHGSNEGSMSGKEAFLAAFKEGADWFATEISWPIDYIVQGEQGSLKLTRVGSVLTGSCSKNDAPWSDPWLVIRSHDYSTPTGLPEWVAVTLWANGTPSTTVEIAFDNFQVSYDQVKFISDPSPLTLLLLD